MRNVRTDGWESWIERCASLELVDEFVLMLPNFRSDGWASWFKRGSTFELMAVQVNANNSESVNQLLDELIRTLRNVQTKLVRTLCNVRTKLVRTSSNVRIFLSACSAFLALVACLSIAKACTKDQDGTESEAWVRPGLGLRIATALHRVLCVPVVCTCVPISCKLSLSSY
jgi:hypothetical protein